MFTRDEAHETAGIHYPHRKCGGTAVVSAAYRERAGTRTHRLTIMTGAARAVHEWSRIDYSARGEECHLAL
jgi:hypothetical protein